MEHLTSKQMKNLKWLAKVFKEEKDNHKYIKRSYLAGLSLEEIKSQFEGLFIEGTDILININKRPLKGGKFEYTAIGYDFIKELEEI